MVDLSFLAKDPIPGIALVVGGLLAVAVAAYGKRDDSHLDELGTFFAFILGIVIGITAFFVGTQGDENWLTLTIMVVLAVTLFLKPMKQLPWAGLVGLAAGGVAVYFASIYLPDVVFGYDQWIFLVIIFFVVGAIVHMLFHFVEDVLVIARMVLDWSPIMVLVGLIAIVEGALLLMDRSILSFF